MPKDPPFQLRRPIAIAPERLVTTLGSWPSPAFLESAPSSNQGSGEAGRWSILAAHPRTVFEARGTAWTLFGDQPNTLARAGEHGPLEALGKWIAELGFAERSTEPVIGSCPFQSGLIGFFGYDVACLLERLPRKSARDSNLPDIRFGLYDTFLTIDHQAGETWLHAFDLLGEGQAAVERRLENWSKALDRNDFPILGRSRFGPLQSNFSKSEYLKTVQTALDYIGAGDIFQINLSQRFEARGQVDPTELYLRMKRISPAPYCGFLRWDDFALLSASPESFYKTEGDRITTRPIKGTRPRGQTPEEDARLTSELLASPKDRAELTMIVDLERNDIGRFCRFGSVKVTDPLAIESFAQVHHLVATIEGGIRPEIGPIDIVRAVFPGGSITGAPKIRAMEIIDELEPNRRSLYTGSLGYFSLNGQSAFNILIRTLLVEGDRVRYQVGGGIVADSDPLTEYEETLHKGRGLRQLLDS